jgi:hypothetical protein
VAFFEDLSPYTYFPEKESLEIVNVGWLDRAHPFPTGETTEEFRAKLGRLCERRHKQTRGFHPCYFCKGQERPTSSAEMRVAGNGRVYAAPSLVHHYVVAHGYRPPDEFVAAVLAWNERGTNREG